MAEKIFTRHCRTYLILAIALLWLAGAVTCFALQLPNMEEGNLPLSDAIEDYGLQAIFAFDLGASILFILIYKAASRFRLFDACMMFVLLSATALDLTNDVSILYFPQLYDAMGFASQRQLFSRFTTASYDGQNLTDYEVTCIAGKEAGRIPITSIFVGDGWKDPHPERNSTMHC